MTIVETRGPVHASNVDSKPNPTDPRAFSVPSYLCAVAVGCVVVGGASSLFFTLQSLGGMAVTAFAGLIVGFFPGLVLFLPAALASKLVANAFGIRSLGYSALLGAVFSFLTASILHLLLAACRVVEWSLWSGAIFGIAGGVAATTYGLIANFEHRRGEGSDTDPPHYARPQRPTP